MTNEQAWEKALAGYTPADFLTEKGLRNVLTQLQAALPEWNLSNEQIEQVVAHWKAQQ